MNLLRAAKVQIRVINALMLREIHTINGGDKLGYLWVLIQSTFGIAVFWGIRVMMGAKQPHGLPMPLFLASGFCVWNIFSETVNKSMIAEKANCTLLTFPQVTLLDSLIARAIVISATQYFVTGVIIVLSHVFGYDRTVIDWGALFALMFIVPFFSLGCGAFFAAFAEFIPVLKKIIPMVLRIMFFASGVIFAIGGMPHKAKEYLAINPVLQFIEWLRGALSDAYLAFDYDLFYLLSLTLLFLIFGLLFNRYARIFVSRKL